MAKEYIEREAAKRELLSWAVCMNHPEYLMRDDALHIIDSFPAADVECCGRLRGVTYEDGKVTAVHIRDTDDAVKVFAPVVHGQWITEFDDLGWLTHTCTVCGYVKRTDVHVSLGWNYCPICGQKADGGED